MAPMHPKKLRETIRSNNQALFDAFLDFPKVNSKQIDFFTEKIIKWWAYIFIMIYYIPGNIIVVVL